MKKDVMKKIAVFILATVMCLSFCACSSTKSKKTSSNKAKTTAVTKKEVKRIEPKPGVWEENTYKNESTNITFTIDKNTKKLTSKELNSLVNKSKEAMMKNFDDKTKEAYEKQLKNTLSETLIFIDKKGSSALLTYEKIPKNIDMDSSAYIKQTVKNEQKTKVNNAKITVKKYGEATIAGDKYSTAELEITSDGSTDTQILYGRVQNGYATCFVTTIAESNLKAGTDFLAKVQHIK